MHALSQQDGDSSRPCVSVIIPAYNTASLISECLNSVFSQTYKDFEAIVVNDGSPDTPELERVLHPYLSRIVYIRQENKRAAGARNTAIGIARGEFLAFLDSDDTWLPDHLSNQMQLFADDPSLDLVYADGLMVGTPGRKESRFMDRCPSRGPATFEALIYERCQVSVSTAVARKSAIVRAGLFDESLLRCDDYDMWVRTAFYGGKIGYRRTVQARFAEGRPGSLGQSAVKMAEAYCLILEKFIRTLPLDPPTLELVRKRLAETKAIYRIVEAKHLLAEGKYDTARKLLAEANQHYRSAKLGLILAGLKLVPSTTGKLASLWTRFLERRAQ
ncbi:MAG TPA: glycosyltransferase family A protein [Terriglobia bacterium]|nr:glycosyltransferase family A protein [Terriglobia bacterium]